MLVHSVSHVCVCVYMCVSVCARACVFGTKEQQVKPAGATRRHVRFSLPLELPASRVVVTFRRYTWRSANQEASPSLHT